MAAAFRNYVLVVCCVLFTLANLSAAWDVNFGPNLTNTTVHMHQTQTLIVTFTGLNGTKFVNANVSLETSDSNILETSNALVLDDISDGTWTGAFNLSAKFLGTTKIHAKIIQDGQTERSNQTLTVIIIREERLIDRIFTISVVALVSILYINFGAALDFEKVKQILVQPFNLLLAFVCKFLLMPLVIIWFI